MRYFSPFILQTFVWIPTWAVLGFLGRFKVLGRENLKGLPRGVIFAANHSSELDPILVPASLNPFSMLMPIFYVARESGFYEKTGFNKFFYSNMWFKLWGAYPAYAGKKDYAFSLQEHVKILNAGKSILIFPEGKKTINGEIGNGKGGIAFLAYAIGAPIVPVAMSGHFKMRPIDFILRKRNIVIRYGKPLYPKDLFPNSQNTLINQTRDDYVTAVNRVMDEVRKLHQNI